MGLPGRASKPPGARAVARKSQENAALSANHSAKPEGPAPSFRRQSALLRLHETKGARAWVGGVRARRRDARLGARGRGPILLVAILPTRAAEASESPPGQAEGPGRRFAADHPAGKFGAAPA